MVPNVTQIFEVTFMWRFKSLLFALLFASVIVAAAPPADYFPLQVGNQWVYRQAGAIGGQPVIVEVLETEQIAGAQYFFVAGLTPEAAWIRVSEDGVLSSLDRESGREALWAVFSAAQGETYNTGIHPCNPVAPLDSAATRVRVPAGEFENALAVSYPTPTCADAGLESDFFVPGIGLVQRTMTSIAGPVTLSLMYARVEPRTVVSQPEVTFSLSLDRAVYTTRLFTPVITARITLRVMQPEPLELTFPSGQRFDLELKNTEGQVVYRWSEDKAFILLFGTERFGPGERNWVLEIPLLDRDGNLFDPGKYTAECWLTTTPERQYTATVAFEISSAREPDDSSPPAAAVRSRGRSARVGPGGSSGR